MKQHVNYCILISMITLKSAIICYGQTYLTSWIEDYNKNTLYGTLSEYYTHDAYLDHLDTLNSYNESKGRIHNIRNTTGEIVDFSVVGETTSNQGNTMLICRLKCKNGDFALMLSLRNVLNKLKCEYEIIRPLVSGNANDGDFVKSQRLKWEEFSNAHNPDGLLNNVYSPRAYYLNQGKLFTGRDSIINEYRYMESPGWKIKLTQHHLLRVSESLAFEIGTYQSSGRGQYLLVWEKLSENSEWTIYLDSNF